MNRWPNQLFKMVIKNTESKLHQQKDNKIKEDLSRRFKTDDIREFVKKSRENWAIKRRIHFGLPTIKGNLKKLGSVVSNARTGMGRKQELHSKGISTGQPLLEPGHQSSWYFRGSSVRSVLSPNELEVWCRWLTYGFFQRVGEHLFASSAKYLCRACRGRSIV